MNKLTATNKLMATGGVAVAGLLTLGGIMFAPKQAAPIELKIVPGVPVELRDQSDAHLADGEATTTVHPVENGEAGAAIRTLTTAKFHLDLPNGEYLIKSVPNDPAQLRNVDDTDSTQPAPSGVPCGDRTGCTWVWVDNDVELRPWGVAHERSALPVAALFQFARQSPPATTQPAGVPGPAPLNRTAPTPAPVPPSTPKIAPAPTAYTDQQVTIWAADETDGLSPDSPRLAGVPTVVMYTDPTTGKPVALAKSTDGNGEAKFTIPLVEYTVFAFPKPGYVLSYTGRLGTHDPIDVTNPDLTNEVLHGVLLKRLPGTPAPQVALPSPTPSPTESATPSQTPPVAAPATTTPNTTTPTTAPEAPVDQPVNSVPTTTVADEATPTTTPETTTPATTVPEATPATSVPVTTVPVTTVPATTVPEAEPTFEEGDDGNQHSAGADAGCDSSDDPEIQALLWLNDGAIRWIEDGDLLTLFPEVGMDPIEVCLDAYHRLTEMGIDTDFYTVKY